MNLSPHLKMYVDTSEVLRVKTNHKMNLVNVLSACGGTVLSKVNEIVRVNSSTEKHSECHEKSTHSAHTTSPVDVYTEDEEDTSQSAPSPGPSEIDVEEVGDDIPVVTDRPSVMNSQQRSSAPSTSPPPVTTSRAPEKSPGSGCSDVSSTSSTPMHFGTDSFLNSACVMNSGETHCPTCVDEMGERALNLLNYSAPPMFAPHPGVLMPMLYGWYPVPPVAVNARSYYPYGMTFTPHSSLASHLPHSNIKQRWENIRSSASHPPDLSAVPNSEPKSKRQKMKESAKSIYAIESKNQPYSFAECQEMINYLIKRNAIAGAYRRETWKKAKAEGMFQQPYRSAESLQLHFFYTLRYAFRNYTNDPVALIEFDKLASEIKVKKPPYTDMERCIMVQYLINNRAISKALGMSIWIKMEAANIFQKPYRSATSLRKHFENHLRHQYMKYTQNPWALKEFKKLQKHRK